MGSFRVFGWLSICFLVSGGLFAQVFQGQGGILIPPDAASGATRGISVSEALVAGVGTLGGCNQLERILINIDHTWVGDVAIFLISPSGTVLELTSGNGFNLDNWRNTEFRDDAPINIIDGTPPYTGAFRPEGRQQDIGDNPPNTGPIETFTLANTFTGESAEGAWQLYINDYVGLDVGEIINWELEFSGGGELDAEIRETNFTSCVEQTERLSVIGTLSPSATYSWSTGETTSFIDAQPTVTTLYEVTVTDGGCSVVLSETLEVTPQPVIVGPATSCGEEITLTTTGGIDVLWSTGEFASSITVAPSVTSTYTASGGGPFCRSEPFTIAVTPLNITATASPAEGCPGDPVTLTATGGSAGATYEWSSGASGASIVVSPTVSTVYEVSVTDGGCSRVVSVPVVVNETSLSVTNDLTTCAGDRITLSAVGTGPFSWSTGEVATSISVAPLVTTVYSVTAGSGSCALTEQVTVTVNPVPTVTASADQASVCAGETVTLTASGDGPFRWSTGATGSEITVTPATTTTYFVEVGTGVCPATDEVTVTVRSAPTLELGGDQTYCAGEVTTLTAGGSFTDISWTTGQTGPTIDLQEEGTQTFVATATNGSCSVTEQVTITVLPQPEVSTGPDQTICAGEPVTLTASGDGPFLWSNGISAPSITVEPAATTTYFVDVSNGQCSDFAEVTVTVLDRPTLDLGEDQTLCGGIVNTLTASGNFTSISWNTGASDATIELQQEGPQTYVATATNGSCSVTEQVVINVLPALRVTAGPDTTVCPGEPVTLTASGDGPFLWSNGITAPSITVVPDETTEYFVDVFNGVCTDFARATVTVAPAPTLDLGPDRTLCASASNTLTADGDFTNLVWADGQTTSTISLHASGTRSYIATATNGDCSVTDRVDITVLAAPAVTASADQTICAGDSITLTAEGTGPFSWSNGQTAAAITVAPRRATVYTVAVGNDDCGATDEVAVAVAPRPEVSLGGDQVFCAGEATSITASGNYGSLTWGDGQTEPTIGLISEGSQTYTVIASLGACTSADTALITVLDAVSVAAGPDLSLCAGDSVRLRATGSGPFTWAPGLVGAELTVRPQQDTSYVVFAGAGGCQVADTVRVRVVASPLIDLGPDRSVCVGAEVTLSSPGTTGDFRWSTGATGDSLGLTLQTTANYAVTVSENGCSASDSVRLSVRAPVFDLGPDRSLCPGDSLVLTGPEASAYAWSTGAAGRTLRLAPTLADTISLAALIDGCTATDTLVITITENQELSLPAEVVICPGDSVELVPSGTGPFRWSTGASGPTITVSPSVSSVFTAAIGSGNCAVTDSVRVSVLARARVDLGDDRVVCAGAEVNLQAEGNATGLTWSTGSGAPEISLRPTTTRVVSVVGTTAEGCTATDSVLLSLVEPRLAVSQPPPLCPGDAFTLRASGLDAYRWGDGSTADTLVVQPRATTTYRLRGSLLGCPVTDSVRVVVRERATVAVGEDRSVCPGDEVVLDAAGSGPFIWSDGTIGDQLRVLPGASQTYFAVAGSGNCRDTAFVNVTVLPPTTVSLGPDLAICPGDSVTLAPVASGPFVYADGDFGEMRRVSPRATTIYRVTATANGCTASDSVVVTVNSPPELRLVATDCAPDNLSYDATVRVLGGLPPYLLGAASVRDTFSLAGLPSGTAFRAEVTDANGCRSELAGLVDCGCTEITLRAAERGCNGSLERRDLTELLPEGAPAGRWVVLNPDANGRPTITSGNALSLRDASAGSYVLQYLPLGAAAECLDGYQTTLVVTDPPSAGRQERIEELCVESAQPIDLFAQLEAAVPGGTWRAISPDLANTGEVIADSGVFDPAGLSAGDYVFQYRAPDGAGCPGTTAEVIVRLFAIEVAGGVRPPSCEDPCAGVITVADPDPLWRYGLDDGSLSATTSFTGLCGGTYLLTAEDDRGCRATQTLNVPTVETPSLTLADPGVLRLGDSTILSLETTTGLDSVIWNQPVNCLTDDCRRVIVRPQQTTRFTARAVSEGGCTATAAATVTVDERGGVYVPTAFSPNDDGTNDRLTVYTGPAVERVTNFRLFDRWGGQLADYPEIPLGDDDFGWDGTTNSGAPVPPGVYVYQFTVTRVDGSEARYSGEVVLMR